jgi:hypothetical protein
MIFNKWIGQSLSCWPKIPCGSPTISKQIVIIFHQDFVASIRTKTSGLYYKCFMIVIYDCNDSTIVEPLL